MGIHLSKNITIVIIFWASSLLLSQEVFEGYTLFTPGEGGESGSYTTYLKDNNLNNIQTWSHSNSPSSMPYLISGGEPGWEKTFLIYPYRVNDPAMENGGVGGGFECLTWEGELVWEYMLSNSDYQHHHDVEPLPNGNVLIVVWERKTATEAYAMGRQTINNPLNQMWSEAVLELDPETGGIVWEWHLWDHLIQDADSRDHNYGVVSDHPQRITIAEGVGSIRTTIQTAQSDVKLSLIHI